MFEPKIEIIAQTPEVEKLCTVAVKQTFKKEHPKELLTATDQKSIETLLGNVMKLGHYSTLEHACFTISFNDVSVFFEEFLIEHRLASYSVKSRRYVDYSQSGYVIPDYFEDKPELKKRYAETMNFLFDTYKYLTEKGIPTEDARFVLPYCFKTSMIVTMNVRELIHFLHTCIYGRGRKFEEVKKIGEMLLEKLNQIAPNIYKDLKSLEPEYPDDEESLKALAHIEKRKYQKRPKVELLWYTDDPDRKVAASALMRSSLAGSEDIEEKLPELKEKIIDVVLNSKRPRELEQVNFTFRVNNVTLSSLTHISRHRIHALMVPSFTEFGKSHDYVLPDKIRSTRDLEKKYRMGFEKSADLHEFLIKQKVPEELLIYNYLSGNFVDIITTMNARELYHFLRLRCCMRAQWEVREIANEMLIRAKKAAPLTFKKAGPSCYLYGRCTEGKFTCGKFAEIAEKYKKFHEETAV
jgi:thymidylate synthase (FAD)